MKLSSKRVFSSYQAKFSIGNFKWNDKPLLNTVSNEYIRVQEILFPS